MGHGDRGRSLINQLRDVDLWKLDKKMQKIIRLERRRNEFQLERSLMELELIRSRDDLIFGELWRR